MVYWLDSGMVHCVAFFICLAGFFLLALSQYRHQSNMFKRELPLRTIRCMRWLAAVFLLMALGLCLAGLGADLGWVAYSGHTSLAAAVVLLALYLHSRRN